MQFLFFMYLFTFYYLTVCYVCYDPGRFETRLKIKRNTSIIVVVVYIINIPKVSVSQNLPSYHQIK